MSDETKPTNPKDIIGCNKIPMHLWPETATMLGAMALLDGMLKYGRSNWRAGEHLLRRVPPAPRGLV